MCLPLISSSLKLSHSREMSSDSLDRWLHRLESLHPTEIELGLERVGEVARQLQLLPLPMPCITLAGTNGKGSTAAVIEAVASAAGLVTGLCSSPHLLSYNERIRVGGSNATDAEIVAAFEAIEQARGDISLTYFEFATLAALYVFQQRQVDLAILEVGLGGRLDAVNIVDADVAVVTNIALDHQDWLGDTRDAIGAEKAGIIRRDKPVVVADRDPPTGLVQAIERAGAQPLFIGRQFDCQTRADGCQVTLNAAEGAAQTIECGGNVRVLPENISAALQALLLAGVAFDPQALPGILAQLQLPGRLQQVELGGQAVLLDVAHNPASINKLHEYISVNPCKKREIALFSVMRDKDIQAMVESCVDQFDAWVIGGQPENKRAADAMEVASCVQAAGGRSVSTAEDLQTAYQQTRSLMEEGDRLVVFGSFHTVAAVMPWVERELGT